MAGDAAIDLQPWNPKNQAQETGPLLMEQELGYTLAGTVAGVGLGVLVWFMDPLNPDVTLRDTTVDGLIVGTLLGSIVRFCILQNALVEPRTNSLPSGLEDLLGQSKRSIAQPVCPHWPDHSHDLEVLREASHEQVRPSDRNLFATCLPVPASCLGSAGTRRSWH